MNGTWTTKPPPKVLETILGAALIVLLIVVGLVHDALSGGGAGHLNRPTPTPASSATPSLPRHGR